MASGSVEEIIGGIDNGGGIPQPDDTKASGLAGGGDANDLWLSNLELGNAIFGIVGLSKIGFITFMWFIYFLAGTKIESYYYWTWLTALLVIYGAWGPVAVTWLLIYTGRLWAETMFFYACLISIIGPMVGYFIPLTLLILSYNERGYTGLVYGSKVHFWLGWALGVAITILTIFFEMAFLPGVRVWYDIKSRPEGYEASVDQSAGDDLEDGPVIFGLLADTKAVYSDVLALDF